MLRPTATGPAFSRTSPARGRPCVCSRQFSVHFPWRPGFPNNWTSRTVWVGADRAVAHLSPPLHKTATSRLARHVNIPSCQGGLYATVATEFLAGPAGRCECTASYGLADAGRPGALGGSARGAAPHATNRSIGYARGDAGRAGSALHAGQWCQGLPPRRRTRSARVTPGTHGEPLGL